jgi:hypothetical protein
VSNRLDAAMPRTKPRVAATTNVERRRGRWSRDTMAALPPARNALAAAPAAWCAQDITMPASRSPRAAHCGLLERGHRDEIVLSVCQSAAPSTSVVSETPARASASRKIARPAANAAIEVGHTNGSRFARVVPGAESWLTR